MSKSGYPLLPKRKGYLKTEDGHLVPMPYYTTDQMLAYVDADRARREPLNDEAIEQATGAKRGTPTFLVAQAFCRAIEAAHGIHERPAA